MKAIVIKYYTDKTTRQKCNVGETVELTKDRFEELNAKGLVEKVKEQKEDKKEK